MAVTEKRIAPDSASDLHKLIGDDATATFESDPKFIDSDPMESASSENVAVQRDADDLEDSEEDDDLEDDDSEDDEYEDAEDEDDDVEDDDEDFDDDDDEEDEDDDEGVNAMASKDAVEPTGLNAGQSTSAEFERAEDGEVEDESGEDSDLASTDRVVDAALRMQAMVAVTAAFAANV